MSPLTIARVGLGLAATLKALELWPFLDRLAGDPRIVSMPLVPWPRPSAVVAHWLVAIWAGLGLVVAAGKAVPIASTLLALLLGYVVTLDQQLYSNHVYLLALLALLLALAHTPRYRTPAIALMRWQLVIVYFFAAASKINPDFLSGRVIAENLRPAVAALLSPHLIAALAVIAIAAEGLVAVSLPLPRWRMIGAALGTALHLGFVVGIRQTVAMVAFAMICVSLYPLFWISGPPRTGPDTSGGAASR